jgi:hypothetical protein
MTNQQALILSDQNNLNYKDSKLETSTKPHIRFCEREARQCKNLIYPLLKAYPLFVKSLSSLCKMNIHPLLNTYPPIVKYRPAIEKGISPYCKRSILPIPMTYPQYAGPLSATATEVTTVYKIHIPSMQNKCTACVKRNTYHSFIINSPL